MTVTYMCHRLVLHDFSRNSFFFSKSLRSSCLIDLSLTVRLRGLTINSGEVLNAVRWRTFVNCRRVLFFSTFTSISSCCVGGCPWRVLVSSMDFNFFRSDSLDFNLVPSHLVYSVTFRKSSPLLFLKRDVKVLYTYTSPT